MQAQAARMTISWLQLISHKAANMAQKLISYSIAPSKTGTADFEVDIDDNGTRLRSVFTILDSRGGLDTRKMIYLLERVNGGSVRDSTVKRIVTKLTLA
jgi:hypothetical protein